MAKSHLTRELAARQNAELMDIVHELLCIFNLPYESLLLCKLLLCEECTQANMSGDSLLSCKLLVLSQLLVPSQECTKVGKLLCICKQVVELLCACCCCCCCCCC